MRAVFVCKGQIPLFVFIYRMKKAAAIAATL